MPIIQCPKCSKKLNAKSVTPGKKVRCPGCQSIFQPGAGGGGPKKSRKPKRKAPVEDEFVDFDDDEMYDEGGFDDEYEERPQRPRRAAKGGGGKAAAGGRKKKGSKSKAAAAKKSKAPLFIGIGVAVVAVIAGITFAVMSGSGDDNGGTDVADTTGAEGTAADNTGGSTPDTTGGNTNTGVGSAPNGSQPGPAGSQPPSGTQTASSGTSSSATGQTGTPANVNLQYLPANSEVVGTINVKQILEGPLGVVLLQLGPQIQEMKDAVGFGPEDIESITIGVGGISDSVSKGIKPDPNNMPATVVFRATGSVDLARMKALIPRAEDVSDGGISYIRMPDPEADGAIWQADSTTVVVGAESWVKQVAQSGAGTPSIAPSLFDSKSAIRVAFVPSNPDAIFRAETPPDSIPDPSAQMLIDFVKVVQPTVSGVGLGLDIGTDIVVTGSVLSNSDQAAQNTATALQTLIDKTKQLESQMESMGVEMGQMAMAMQQGKAVLETFQVQATGSTTTFSFTSPQGGAQLQAFAPMMVPMVMQGMAAGQQAAEHVVVKNNLKQISLALMNFHDAYKRFPNSTAKGPSGEKWLSWRVHVLPFLGHQALYDQFALEEPWDSPTNRPLVDMMPDVYRSDEAEDGKTLVQVVVGPGTMWEGTTGRSLRDCTDGTSNTISVVITSPERAVYWTQPEDYSFDPNDPTAGLGTEPGVFMAALTDGSVQNVDSTFNPQVVKGLFTRNGGEPVSRDIFVETPSPGGGFGPPGGGFGPPGGGFGPPGGGF